MYTSYIIYYGDYKIIVGSIETEMNNLSSTCRIQLRLPTGGTSVIQLNKTDSLEVLRDTIAKVSRYSVVYCLLMFSCLCATGTGRKGL